MIQIVSKLKFNWLKGFREKFEESGFRVQVLAEPEYDKDVSLYLMMWSDAETIEFLNRYDVKNVTFLRRYELFMPSLEVMDFSKVNRLIVLNDYIQLILKNNFGADSTIIPNGVILNDWSYKKRSHGKDIAWVGYVDHRKNIQLAMEILSILPDDYTLHVAGEIRNAEAYHYANYIAFRSGKNVKWYHRVDDMDAWLEGKNYLLNTSVSEGCPNCVIEAMAKGIKPIVHAWPGADFLFGDDTFYFPYDAVNAMMESSEYDSEKYRKEVEDRFADSAYERVVKIAKEIIGA